MQLIARLSMVDPEIERRRKEEEKASLQLIARMSMHYETFREGFVPKLLKMVQKVSFPEG